MLVVTFGLGHSQRHFQNCGVLRWRKSALMACTTWAVTSGGKAFIIAYVRPETPPSDCGVPVRVECGLVVGECDGGGHGCADLVSEGCWGRLVRCGWVQWGMECVHVVLFGGREGAWSVALFRFCGVACVPWVCGGCGVDVVLSVCCW